MLPTNSILQQGRYRIIENTGSGLNGELYDAYDNLLGSKIVVNETLSTQPKIFTAAQQNVVAAAFTRRIVELKDLKCDGLVRVRDGFSEVDRQYLVTEPVESRHAKRAFTERPAETISRLLHAIAFVFERDTGNIEITPQHIRCTASGTSQLLYFGAANAAESEILDRTSIPYQALETLWDGLDLASQKAISNSYDDDSLTVLESPADIRTAIYSLGATVYQVLTSTPPVDALERSIEMLDGKADPLIPPSEVVPSISDEFSDFILKAMAIRRDDRFESIVDAEKALSLIPPSVPATFKADSERVADLFGDDDILGLLDVLEIPSAPAEHGPVSPQRTVTPAASDSLPSFDSSHNHVDVKEFQFDPQTAEALMGLEPKESAIADGFVAEPTPLPAPSQTLADDMPGFLEAKPPANSKTFRVAAGAIAAAIVIAAAVWGVTSFTTVGQAGVIESRVVTPTTNANPSAVTPKPEPTPAPEIVSAPAAEITDGQSVAAATSDRPVVKAKQSKPVEQPPPAKQTPKPKKAVTVDDLISDN